MSNSVIARPRVRTVSQTIQTKPKPDITQDGDGVLTAKQIHEYRETWDKMVSDAHGISYQQAAFLKLVRSKYPAHASGLLQFRTFARKVLRVTAGKALVSISMVGGIHRYSEQDWRNYGGLQGLMHMHNLPGNAWKRVRSALDARIASEGRPLTYDIIRDVALKMGFRSTSLKGRPTQSATEVKVQTLRSFIVSCYTKGVLPEKLPANVVQAMSKSTLEQIREAVSSK